MFLLYEVLLYMAFLLAFPWFLITGVLRGKYLTNFGPRFGFYQGTASRHDLWIHAVSVGEVLAARPANEEYSSRIKWGHRLAGIVNMGGRILSGV